MDKSDEEQKEENSEDSSKQDSSKQDSNEQDSNEQDSSEQASNEQASNEQDSSEQDSNEQDSNERESLAALGALLSERREHNGLAMQEYAERLKIRVNYLTSLEEGNVERLPGPVFYIAFAKSYASALGLDASDFVGKVRRALQDRGLLASEVTLVPKLAPSLPLEQAGDVSGKLGMVGRKIASQAEDGIANESALGVMSLSNREDVRFPTKPIVDAVKEKQALRETIFSPVFIFGGAIGLVLIYLGGVIVFDLLGDGGEDLVQLESAVRTSDEDASADVLPDSSVALDSIEEAPQARTAAIYGALGPTRVILEALEECWIAVFSTEDEEGIVRDASLLFAGTLQAGDIYRVPVQLGIILKSGNLRSMKFYVHGLVVEPFRVESPSGFMSLEPVYLRNRTSIREGGALARERLPVVREIELLREQRAEAEIDAQGSGN